MTNLAIAQVQWAKQIYSSSTTYGEYGSIITDGINNYMIGKFGNNLYLPNDTLSADGRNDIFISKFDANGNNLWSKRIGGNSNSTEDSEDANGVYDSVNNCIYLSGHFVNYISFGAAGTLYGNSDIFLAKMDLNGNFIWAKKAGGLGYDQAQVYVNPYGKIYLVAQVSDSAYFDSFHIGHGGALVTYDNNGTCLSAEVKYNSDIFSDYNFVGVNFMNKDVIYFGSFISSSFNIDNITMLSNGGYDGFVALADSSGNINWAQQIGGTSIDFIGNIAISSNGDIFVTGGLADSIDFFGQNISNTGNDIFIAKVNSSGNLCWVKKFNLNSNDNVAGSAIEIESNGNIVLCGNFNGIASLGTSSYSSYTSMDVFIAKFDTSGVCLSFTNFGQSDLGSMVIDNYNNVILCGTYSNLLNVSNFNFSVLGSNSDIYLAKFDANTGTNTRTAPNNSLIIYANPNKGTCNISIPDDLKNSPSLTLQIYNAQGSLIQKQAIQQMQDKVKLNLDAEAKGIYNVTLTDGSKIYYGKIVFD